LTDNKAVTPSSSKQALKDGFKAPDRLIPLDQALAFLAEKLLPVVGVETVPLAEASGRILAEDVVSTIESPPFASAAMDGFALRQSDLPSSGDKASLRVVARIAAGHHEQRSFGPGEAARIFTGAPLPNGLDTVVMQEDCRVWEDDNGETVSVPTGLAVGQHVRQIGEDIRAGARVLRAGRRLRPQEVAMAATVGLANLAVYRRLKVAVFSTGDEIFEPGQPLPPGGIYTSNRYSLIALAQGLGCEVDDLGNLPDHFEATRQALSDAGHRYDLLITSGGVSAGGEDHVRPVVESLGAIHLWRLAIKPGKPAALGHVGDAAFVGLSGYPVAAQVTFMILARPVILRLSGALSEPMQPWRFRVPAAAPFNKSHGRREFVRARLEVGPDGATWVVPHSAQGSGAVSSLVEGEGLVDMKEDLRYIAPGEMADFIPYQTVQW
jgi:molybdopterin molybdotransferase